PVARTRRPKPGRSRSKKTLSVTPGGSTTVRTVCAVNRISYPLWGTARVHFPRRLVPAHAAIGLMVYRESRSFTSPTLSLAFSCGSNIHSVGLGVDFYMPDVCCGLSD